jgi:hypothetical protein
LGCNEIKLSIIGRTDEGIKDNFVDRKEEAYIGTTILFQKRLDIPKNKLKNLIDI